MSVDSTSASLLVDFLENKYEEGQRVNTSSKGCGLEIMRSKYGGYVKTIGGRSSQTPEKQLSETVTRVFNAISAVWTRATGEQRSRLVLSFSTKLGKTRFGSMQAARLQTRLSKTPMRRSRKKALGEAALNTSVGRGEPAAAQKKKPTLLGSFLAAAATP